MQRLWIFFRVVVIFAGLVWPASAASRSGQIDALFREYTKAKTPGYAVAVLQNGRVYHQRCYGFADLGRRRLITSDSAFDLASVSKQFTAMAIMILQENGELNYDDALTDYLPEFEGLGDEITIRHLLNHTSGLPEYEPLFKESGSIDLNYPRALPGRVGFEPTVKDVIALLAKQKSLRFKPGEKYEYCDSGYVVLAEIIEQVSGLSYARYLHENIFRPLGMKGTAVYDEARPVIRNRAFSYSSDGFWLQPIDYTPLNLIYGDGNVNATLSDMIKWDRAWTDHKLVAEETEEEAFTPGKLNSGEETHYGFGWLLGQRDGNTFGYHGGSWVGFRSYIMHDPDDDLSVIVLANFSGAKPREMGEKIAKIWRGN